MGTMYHHTIVVTSCSKELILDAHTKASKIFPNVSEIVDGVVNGYASFFIPPDGSKEGWKEDFSGDERRTEFVKYLESKRYEDGSTSLEWVEVAFGGGEYECDIVSHS